MLYYIADKLDRKERLDRADALALFEWDDIFALGDMAEAAALRHNGDNVYFVRNHHINPTNICLNRCRFCAFSRSEGEEGAYELSIEEILHKIGKQYTELHIVGGLHPEWSFDYYLELISSIKGAFPKTHIKAFTAVEIDHFSNISGFSLKETLTQLKDHGLDAMPGGGAEIFSEEVRERLCPEKISAVRWLEVHEAAHNVGIKTNATMLYGHIESYADRVDHLFRLRELQDKTKGLQAFIPLSYHPKNTDTGGGGPSGIDDLRTIAVSRLVLDNVPHIKAYWIMLGEKMAQTALLFGADDLDGTVIEERITHSAGAVTGESLTVDQIRFLIERAGKRPVERDSFYNEQSK